MWFYAMNAEDRGRGKRGSRTDQSREIRRDTEHGRTRGCARVVVYGRCAVARASSDDGDMQEHVVVERDREGVQACVETAGPSWSERPSQSIALSRAGCLRM